MNTIKSKIRKVPYSSMSIIKFHKVPELFPNRKVRIVRTEQLWWKQRIYGGNTASLLYVCNDDKNCMNCTYTVNHKKVGVHLCHNVGKYRSIFRIVTLKQEEIFKTCINKS